MPKMPNFLKGINKKILFGIPAAFLLIAGLITFAILYRDNRAEKKERDFYAGYDRDSMFRAYNYQGHYRLIYPEAVEILDFSMVPYRPLNFSWTEAEVQEFWIPPKKEDIDLFSEANHKLIWEILKDAP